LDGRGFRDDGRYANGQKGLNEDKTKTHRPNENKIATADEGARRSKWKSSQM
jgi:hypothetical protein